MGSSATHATAISLNVTAPVANDFSISASPSSLSLSAGQNGTATISTAVTSGAAQTLSLSASGLPAGATASFSPASMPAGGQLDPDHQHVGIHRRRNVCRCGHRDGNLGDSRHLVDGDGESVWIGPAARPGAGAGETASSTSLTATFSNATAAGHLLVLSASVYSGATNQITRVSDSAGNAWVKIGAFSTAGHFSDGEMWYAANANPVTSVTVTVTTATVVAMEVLDSQAWPPPILWTSRREPRTQEPLPIRDLRHRRHRRTSRSASSPVMVRSRRSPSPRPATRRRRSKRARMPARSGQRHHRLQGAVIGVRPEFHRQLFRGDVLGGGIAFFKAA